MCVLQIDGYAGHRALAEKNSVQLASAGRAFATALRARRGGCGADRKQALERIRRRPRTMVARKTRDDQSEYETGGGDPLCPFAVDGGAEHWATISSLVDNYKLNGVDPQTYLADVLARIVNCRPNDRINGLRQWC